MESMDSFYGDLSPRELPRAASFCEISLDSQMSNLSLLCDKNKKSKPTSYNVWKLQNENETNKLNSLPSHLKTAREIPNSDIVCNSSFIKKQVRFNMQTRSENLQPETLANHQQSMQHNFNRNHIKNSPLELSIVEPRPSLSQLNNYFNTYDLTKPISRQEHTNSIDFTMVPFKERDYFCENKMCRCEPKTYNEWRIQNANKQLTANVIPETQTEPTISKLYDIIKNQNEDLKKLQKQVEMLLERKEQPLKIPVIEKSCCCEKIRNEKKSTDETPKQISIGVMTSFENNQNINDNNDVIINRNTVLNIPEPTDSNSVEETQKQDLMCHYKNAEFSKSKEFSLNEIAELPESLNETQTPMGSIHVDLHEYSDDSSNESEEENIPNGNIGWTIYKNVVGQVKNILQKSPPCNEEIDSEAAVQINNLDEICEKNKISSTPKLTDRVLLNRKCKDSGDLSIEINQLVMKYLQDDQLSFLVSKSQFVHPIKNAKNSNPYALENNEISIATVKYMQKYHWGQASKPKIHCRNNEERKMPIPLPRTKQSSKILDITVLKQQPKLL